MSKKTPKKVTKFYKSVGLQIYGYLAIIPFVFAFITLKKDFKLLDAVIYFTGLSFLLIIILLNHIDPILRITKDKIILYNSFNSRPIILLKKDFMSFDIISNKEIKLHFKNRVHGLTLTKRNMTKFIKIIEEIN